MLDLTYGIHPSALAVLHILAPRLPPDGFPDSVVCAPLFNGRERGIGLSVWNGRRSLLLFFAEDRCSDSLFLWEERSNGMLGGLNPPTVANLTNSGYESRKFYAWDDIMGIVRDIEARIAEFLAEGKR